MRAYVYPAHPRGSSRIVVVVIALVAVPLAAVLVLGLWYALLGTLANSSRGRVAPPKACSAPAEEIRAP